MDRKELIRKAKENELWSPTCPCGSCALIQSLIAALESAEGREWISVPREPTERMLKELGRMTCCEAQGWGLNHLRAIYKVLIAAAEDPPK